MLNWFSPKPSLLSTLLPPINFPRVSFFSAGLHWALSKCRIAAFLFAEGCEEKMLLKFIFQRHFLLSILGWKNLRESALISRNLRQKFFLKNPCQSRVNQRLNFLCVFVKTSVKNFFILNWQLKTANQQWLSINPAILSEKSL